MCTRFQKLLKSDTPDPETRLVPVSLRLVASAQIRSGEHHVLTLGRETRSVGPHEATPTTHLRHCDRSCRTSVPLVGPTWCWNVGIQYLLNFKKANLRILLRHGKHLLPLWKKVVCKVRGRGLCFGGTSW